LEVRDTVRSGWPNKIRYCRARSNRQTTIPGNGQTDLPYADENVNRWLTEIIYGGRPERDVLQDYEQFIVNCVI
jgi:hypothetical protein